MIVLIVGRQLSANAAPVSPAIFSATIGGIRLGRCSRAQKFSSLPKNMSPFDRFMTNEIESYCAAAK
jgi:putative hemolysin